MGCDAVRAVGVLVALAICFCGAGPNAWAAAPQGTTTYEEPVELELPNFDGDFGQHAVTRLIDWDADQDLDLLVGAGDGKVWLLRNEGAAHQPKFSRPVAVMVGDQELQLGKQTITACAADINGDGRFDLVVAHSDTQVVWLENIGTKSAPRWQSPQTLVDAERRPVALPAGCGGRIDLGDLGGDGRLDLVAGAFSGPLVWLKNIGTAEVPRFAAPQPILIAGVARGFSYNIHPTLFDLNQDGRCDIAYGMNWGTFGFLLASDPRFRNPRLRDPRSRGRAQPATPSQPTAAAARPEPPATNASDTINFIHELSPGEVTGRGIDLRARAGDDATPTFGDLDHDGTLDIVSGGRRGKLFWLRGVPLSRSLKRLEQIMTEHRDDLGPALRADEALRRELSGHHHGLYRLCQGFLVTPPSRHELRNWLVRHLDQHQRWLKHARHDVETAPYIPSIAAQTWTTLMLCHDGDPDHQDHRARVADVIGFTGKLREILCEFGTLIVENGRATPNQQQTLYSYLSQIPRELLGDRSIPAITQVITIGEYLGPRLDILNEGGVNIFANESGVPKSSENSFPKDFLPRDNDYFGLVLAHELNHRVDATRFVSVPKYNQRYWRHLRKICGSDVIFQAADGIGVDWPKTKQHFREQNLWDGEPQRWNEAWANYWLTGPGKSRVLNVCRNETTYTPPRFGIPFFLETRQEAVASLANQYFTDSVHMLEFALDRYRRGSPGCLDEWLLMADVYSLDGPQTFLYRHRNGSVLLERTTARLTRDEQSHIKSITIGDNEYHFELDQDGLVESVKVQAVKSSR